MRIIKVNIPSDCSKFGIPVDGLSDIRMEKLDDIVILAGKNGSGKSRILNRIKEVFLQKKNEDTFDNIDEKIEVAKSLISKWENLINDTLTNTANLNTYSNKIEDQKRLIEDLNKAKEKVGFLVTSGRSETCCMIDFFPKSVNLTDSYIQTKEGIQLKVQKSSLAIGTDDIEEYVLSKIQHLYEKWIIATHHNSKYNEMDKKRIIDEYNSFNIILERFLGTRLDGDLDNNATLFGFRIGEARLSSGQIILLQLCMAIHLQKQKISDIIIVMDEPENHLHPSVAIDIIDSLRKSMPEGQIWIATHSIPILAHYGARYIHYVDKGKVQYAGNIPDVVLTSLLGDENEKQKLLNFISLPEHMAIERFAYECLLPPETKMTGRDDPQNNQIREVLTDLKKKKGNVKILDFGSGKGRLLSYLYECDENINVNLDYIAYDIYGDNNDVDKNLCVNAIEQIYGDAKKRCYNSITDLKNEHNDGSFDLIVMCNVLHEIEPQEWIKLFQKNGELSSLLNCSGYLLLVEDTLLPIGEFPNKTGYVVLDTEDIKRLFNYKSQTSLIYTSSINKRLKAHLIEKKQLVKITPTSKKNCLIGIKNRAEREIKRIRNTGSNGVKDGRLYAFWTMQYVSVSFLLDEL